MGMQWLIKSLSGSLRECGPSAVVVAFIQPISGKEQVAWNKPSRRAALRAVYVVDIKDALEQARPAQARRRRLRMGMIG